MNGGRLSDDEAFLIGVGEMRTLLAAAAPDAATADRALARIAVRYPEQAEQLRELWGAGGRGQECAAVLAEIETQHQADSEDDDA